MEELYDTIERYLNGEFSEQERKDFEAQLQTDTELQMEVALVREVRERLSTAFRQQQENEDLKSTLQNIGNEHFKPEAVPRTPAKIVPLTQRWWLLAAALALVMAVIFLLRPRSDLYQQYADIPNAAFTVKGELPTQAMTDAENYFNQKKYPEALRAIELWLAASPGDQEATFYKGICLLETGKLSEAETVFQSQADADSAYAEDARWFLALTYLKGKDFSKCKLSLTNIPTSSFWYEKSLELAADLE